MILLPSRAAPGFTKTHKTAHRHRRLRPQFSQLRRRYQGRVFTDLALATRNDHAGHHHFRPRQGSTPPDAWQPWKPMSGIVGPKMGRPLYRRPRPLRRLAARRLREATAAGRRTRSNCLLRAVRARRRTSMTLMGARAEKSAAPHATNTMKLRAGGSYCMAQQRHPAAGEDGRCSGTPLVSSIGQGKPARC